MTDKNSFSGIINVNKPVGLTSFQVVGRIRKLLGVKKVGHCGTLDPFASGVLPVCVGKATRVVRYMDGYDKTYRCTVHFGASTDTQDREGKVTGGRMPSQVELEQMKTDDFAALRKLFSDLDGDKDQMPPMYSAIKMAGRPLYEYARQGITLERQTRQIRIYNCEVHSITADEMLAADFSLSCSKGTYIRTICDELGKDLGFGAYADALMRTRCGPFSIDSAFSLEDLERLSAAGQVSEFLLPEDLAVAHMPRFEVSEEEAAHIRLGQQMPLEIFEDRMILTDTDEMHIKPHFCAYYSGQLLAIVLPDEKEGRNILRIERMLA
ncbi:MAG: tRNA pseudouridine(55) synthase TruB [Eubacteriales bacterium]